MRDGYPSGLELGSGARVTNSPDTYYQVALVVKNRPASTGGVRDTCLIPGSGRSLEEGMATHSSTLAWRSLWTEGHDGLWSIGPQRVRHDGVTKILNTYYLRQSI